MIEEFATVFCFFVFAVLSILSVQNEERIRDIAFKRYIENKYRKSKSDGYIFVEEISNEENETEEDTAFGVPIDMLEEEEN